MYEDCRPHTQVRPYTAMYCGIPPANLNAGAYIEAFERSWNSEEMLPQNKTALRAALNKVSIFWQPKIFRISDSDRRLLGLTFSERDNKIRVLVYVPPDCKDAGCTSLGHELMHVAYGAIDKDMRVGHLTESARWPKSHMDFLEKVRIAYHER